MSIAKLEARIEQLVKIADKETERADKAEARKPAIFTVYVWRIVDGKRQLELHLVAGFDSKDAERNIKETSADHLEGEAYITTDERNAMYHNPAVRCYVNGGTKEENISDENFKSWVRTMTRAYFEDGELVTAGVRRI